MYSSQEWIPDMNIQDVRADKKLQEEIKADEGFRSHPYKDTSGFWSGGWGHNLEAHGCSRAEISSWFKTGIPEGLAKEWFSEDLDAAITCCGQIFEGFDALPDEAQRVLVNMAFDLMYELWDWTQLQSDVAGLNWNGAARAILQSRFAVQAPRRAARFAARMQAIV